MNANHTQSTYSNQLSNIQMGKTPKAAMQSHRLIGTTQQHLNS